MRSEAHPSGSAKETAKNIENSLWDDTDCSVEEEFNSGEDVKSPNESLKFTNTLLLNKGNIRTAKKLIAKDDVQSIKIENEECFRVFSLSDSESSVGSVSLGSEESLEIKIFKVIPKQQDKYAQRQVSWRENKKWEALWENQQLMSSRKIIMKLLK